MKEKFTHDEKILMIVARKKETPTYEIIRQGINAYVGNPDRALRRLQEKNLVFGEVLYPKTRYKYWTITNLGKKYLKEIKNKKQNKHLEKK